MMSGQKTLAFTLVNWTLRRANFTTPSKNFVRVYSIHQTKMADLKKIITENRKIVNPSTYCLILSILLSGDIHINPGPIKYACTLSSITNPTCFKKGCTPSLVDVILTNQKNMCFNFQNIPTGISDCHNLISVTMKGKVQSQQQKNISYRSYKNFNVDIFNSELIQVAFPDIENIETSEQVNNAYMQYQDTFIHILNKHAPVKTRRPRKNPFPCMNSELRGSIYKTYVVYPIYQAAQC